MIDEKKLIEEIKKFPVMNGEYDNEIADPSYVDGMEAACMAIIETIKEMPKVGEWIPCSERLPEEARAIEVTMYDGSRAIGHFYKSLEAWFDSINGGAIDVIAWKEPSEPWEGEK